MIRTRLILTVLSIFGSFGSFLAYSLLLKYWGPSSELDLFFSTSSIPLAISGIVSGLLLYILPPYFTRVDACLQQKTVEAALFLLIAVMVFSMSVVTICGALQRDLSIFLFWVGFSLVAFLLLLVTLLTCVAQAKGAFYLSAIGPILISVGTFGGVGLGIFFHFLWWVLIGQIIGASFAVIWLVKFLSINFSIRRMDCNIASSILKPLWAQSVMVAIGTLSFTLFQPMDAVLCANLVPGSVSVMSYAQRIIVAVGTALSFGAYTIVSRASSDSLRVGGAAAVRRLANAEVFRLVILGLVVWVTFRGIGNRLLVFVFSSKAMGLSDISKLYGVVSWMLLGIGPMTATPYLFRILYVKCDFVTPAALGLLMPFSYCFISWLLIPFFDLMALAYSYTFLWWFTLGIVVFRLNMCRW